MVLIQPIHHIITDISLHRDLLPATRRLRHRAPCREFLPERLGRSLQIQPKSLQSRNFRNVFTFVALDALDDDLAGSALLRRTRLGGFGFGGFFVSVLFGAFLGVNREGAEVGGDGRVGVQGAVELGVVF